ncbi:unnamed protein product [Linum tenue]|uniref:Uncharacterized protein n=1 Tax=Linum tenue TaxID=586396 RepID=A0AAV0P1F7_9ROSI|nr:unnamed protein product [Linum tenue]
MCRNKIEKLRSRYRVELHAVSSDVVGSNWPYFALSDLGFLQYAKAAAAVMGAKRKRAEEEEERREKGVWVGG